MSETKSSDSKKNMLDVGADKTERVAARVRKEWAEERKKKKPSLTKVLLSQASGLLTMAVIFFFFNIMAQLVPSIVLPYLIDWLIYDPAVAEFYANATAANISFDIVAPPVPVNIEYYWGWIYVAIIGVTAIMAAFFEMHAMLWAHEAATRIRAAIMVLVYNKSLVAATDSAPPTGKIMNLLTSDVNIIGLMLPQILLFSPTPLQLIAIMVLLWMQIGPYSLISLGILILVMPFAGFAGKQMYAKFAARQAASDVRVKLITELVNGIRIVKYYAWEKPIMENIQKSRIQELKLLRSVFNWGGALFMTLGSAPVLAIALTFIFYGLFETPNLSALFTALNLLTLMRFVFFMLPTLFQGTSQASINRVQVYLETDEIGVDEEALLSGDLATTEAEGEVRVLLQEATFSWNVKGDVLALHDISLELDKNTKLTMVAGLVGSGKSALAQALINQLYLVSGSCKVTGSIAYVPQTAWIMNDTVKNNILFGRPYDEQFYKYERVIHAVSLPSDLKLMPNGDETEIGERGVNLSGGQKQRISIARALYSDRDVYVLDDPLSAVDAHVGKHIFDNAIKGLLKNKLTVLITNNLQYLPESERVLYFDAGRIVADGSFRRLLKSNDRFAALMKEHGIFKKRSSEKDKANSQVEEVTGDHGADGQYMDEGKEEGSVPMTVYWFWAKNAGAILMTIFVLGMMLQAATQVVTFWWLQYWPTDYIERLLDNTTETRETGFYLGIYSGLNLGGVVFTVIVFIAAFRMVLISARRIHSFAMKRAIRAPISFFDTTPVGRTDMTIVDTQLLGFVWQTAQAFFNVIGVIATIAMGLPWILIAVPFFGVAYWFVQFIYRKSSIEIQRLEAVTRAPLFSHFSETLNGITTVRAYKKEAEFFETNKKRLELHNSVYYALRYTQSWFGLVLGLLSAVLQIAVYVLVIVLRLETSDYDPGLLVVAISVAPQLTLMLKMMATAVTQLEVQMNAVERLKEYQKLPQEPDDIIADSRPPEAWPTAGKIQFDDFSFRYRPSLPLVLKNISLTVKPGERIGIIGRTGSGKSTLVSAIYRLEEPAQGRILIDDVDICSIGVEDLRSQLSIIPQEPQLFVGTLRYNVDPFNKHTDAEIWEALEVSGLKTFVSELSGGLDEPVLENGSNFSAGQRQLFCLARALLRRTKILVLDEATASVDFDTDLLIQNAIRKHFPHTTLLVIAHRLNTVMDMNRILALSDGALVEFDSPKKLAVDKKSMLYSMIQATGKRTAKHLTQLALGDIDFVNAMKKLKDDEKADTQDADKEVEKAEEASGETGSEEKEANKKEEKGKKKRRSNKSSKHHGSDKKKSTRK